MNVPSPKPTSELPGDDKLRALVPDSITASLAADRAIEAMVAAATPATQKGAQRLSRLTEPWQTKSFTYYDLIGEIHYASNFYARGMSGVRFYAAERDEDGRIVETEDQDAIAAVARINDPGWSGRDQLAETYGRVMFIAGAGYMLWTRDPEEEQPDSWEFVSSDELRIQDGRTFYRYRADGLPPEGITNAPDDQFEPLPGECRVWRYHTPHPRLSMMADSPMRAILDLCEELWLLTRVVRARIKSRLAGNGILKVPIEVSPIPVTPPPTTGNGSATEPTSQVSRAQDDPQADPFIRHLIQHLVAPISDDGSASSVAPLVVRGPAVALKELQHVTLSNSEEKYQEIELRNEAIRRIALGLDMPPEALLGMADSNHWTGWIIDEQTWENIRPIVQGFCRNVTTSYLVPEMEALDKPNPASFLLWYDPSELLTDPDRGAAADAAHDRGTISDRAYREARGFKETDAPTDEEPNTQITAAPAPSDQPPPGDAGGEGEPPNPAQGDTQQEDGVTAGLGSMILGAAEMTVDRARELAGSRLFGAMQGGDAGEIPTCPKGDLAAHLGPERVAALGIDTPLALVTGASEPFVASLLRWGIPRQTAESLAHLVELHAAMTLTDARPRPLPATFLTKLAPGADRVAA